MRESNFLYLKEQLQSIDLLIHPSFSKPFVLTTDASDNVVGFTLCQEVEGELLPVLYGGRTLIKAEKNYRKRDKELLGGYFAVKKCEFYLLGNEYALYTDHQPLIHFRTFRNLFNNGFRWIEYSENMNVKIFCVPGKKNIVSDVISRNISEEKTWNPIDVEIVDLELTNYNVGETLEKQSNDI